MIKTSHHLLLAGLAAVGLAVAGAGSFAVGQSVGRSSAPAVDTAPVLLAQVDAAPTEGPPPAAVAPSSADAPAAPTTETAPIEPPDPIAAPVEAWTWARAVWQRGGWQFAVCLVWLVAVVITRRMRPADTNGDGRPDPVGWHGRTWSIAVGVLAVAGPAAAVALGAEGAGWQGVLVGVPVLIAAVMDAANPQRGAAAKAVA